MQLVVAQVVILVSLKGDDFIFEHHAVLSMICVIEAENWPKNQSAKLQRTWVGRLLAPVLHLFDGIFVEPKVLVAHAGGRRECQ